MITSHTATVYYSPAAGRRYLSKRSAINAETNAIIRNKYPDIDDSETGDTFYYKSDLENYPKIFRRLRRLVKKSMECKS